MVTNTYLVGTLRTVFADNNNVLTFIQSHANCANLDGLYGQKMDYIYKL